jgi:hypothetical protein
MKKRGHQIIIGMTKYMTETTRQDKKNSNFAEELTTWTCNFNSINVLNTNLVWTLRCESMRRERCRERERKVRPSMAQA